MVFSICIYCACVTIWDVNSLSFIFKVFVYEDFNVFISHSLECYESFAFQFIRTFEFKCKIDASTYRSHHCVSVLILNFITVDINDWFWIDCKFFSYFDFFAIDEKWFTSFLIHKNTSYFVSFSRFKVFIRNSICKTHFLSSFCNVVFSCVVSKICLSVWNVSCLRSIIDFLVNKYVLIFILTCFKCYKSFTSKIIAALELKCYIYGTRHGVFAILSCWSCKCCRCCYFFAVFVNKWFTSFFIHKSTIYCVFFARKKI